MSTEQLLTRILNEQRAQRVLITKLLSTKQDKPVSRKIALKETGLSDWELRNAIKSNSNIMVGRNKYDLKLLRTA